MNLRKKQINAAEKYAEDIMKQLENREFDRSYVNFYIEDNLPCCADYSLTHFRAIPWDEVL